MAEDDQIQHREWGRRANQRVWALLADGKPTVDNAIREVVEAAHASLWHWTYAGGDLERQRGEWLISHVYAVLGDGPNALRYAQWCWDLTEAQRYVDFDFAYACEALTRAYAVNGDAALAAEWRAKAVEAGTHIANHEDREIFESDLASA
ncbi:MAG: hypothetical protein QOI08_585 [Actinomycetota bacterium]|jgi:hypothetical protein|nr:hypothetical protein [Actinomycetota bacterium]